MKKLLLTASCIALMTASAYAADLPSRTHAAMAPVTPPPVFTWTGGYVGINGGYVWGRSTVNAVLGGSWIGDPDNAGVTAAAHHRIDPTSAIFGLQVGWNYQINSLVFGVEADANYLGLRKSYATGTLYTSGTGTYSGSGSVSSDWLVTLRPRLGVAVNNLFLYVTGGLAIADHRFSQSLDYVNVIVPPALPPTTAAGGANAGSTSSTKVGWVLGVGAEWAFAKNWSVKAEYLHADLGKVTFGSTYTESITAPPLTYTATHKNILSVNIARIGLNYHF